LVAERIVAGRYELLERLGPGWRARDADLGREVVLLLGEEADAAPEHPSIGRIFDRGEADGEQFAVFEYLPGEPEPTTLIQPPPPTVGRRLPRTRTLAILAGILLIAAAGIGAAFLATAGTSNSNEPTTGTLSLPVVTAPSTPPTEQSEPPPPTTTEQETTTEAQTTEAQTTEAQTTEAQTTAPTPTTAPSPTTAPPATTTPPPTTEPPPPTTTEEPPPTTTEEPPPPTTG
jgi:hypothetical protein